MSQHKITKRADGRYKVNYGTKQFYGKTRAEAERKREAWIDDEKAGLNHDMENMTFREYALTWIEVYRTECCEKQRREYIRMMEYAASRIKVKLMKGITATDLQAVCNSLSCYSPTYVGKFMTTLRGDLPHGAGGRRDSSESHGDRQASQDEKVRGAPRPGAMGARTDLLYLSGPSLWLMCDGHDAGRPATRRGAVSGC